MHFDLEKRTILLVTHGSYAYGLNIEGSDRDIKGICVPPKNCYFGCLSHFEQSELMNSKHGDVDSIVYALSKFVKLAIDANPNIIEVLHVADEDILNIDSFGEELRAIKDDFLSKKARFTFSGYATSQLKRIKTHRSWLLNPPKSEPDRKDFGLTEVMKVSQSELGVMDAAVKSGIEIELPKDILTLFTREKQYQAAKTSWDQYVNWVKSRNPARATLEAKFGYDTKCAMHLIRLMKMCKEILVSGKVVVKRHDRDELLAIRSGTWTYDEIVEYAETLDIECEELYKTSSLRKEPDRVMLDNKLVDITERYLSLHG
jgi:predicted nucleotidyltransferase